MTYFFRSFYVTNKCIEFNQISYFSRMCRKFDLSKGAYCETFYMISSIAIQKTNALNFIKLCILLAFDINRNYLCLYANRWAEAAFILLLFWSRQEIFHKIPLNISFVRSSYLVYTIRIEICKYFSSMWMCFWFKFDLDTVEQCDIINYNV